MTAPPPPHGGGQPDIGGGGVTREAGVHVVGRGGVGGGGSRCRAIAMQKCRTIHCRRTRRGCGTPAEVILGERGQRRSGDKSVHGAA